MKSLLYFTSPTCAPCKTFRPVVEKYAKENPQVDVVLYDLGREEDREAFQNFGVQSVPTLILMDEIDRHVGALSKDELTKFVEKGL